jgi:putative flippase GtrA
MIEQLRSADWLRVVRYLSVGGLNASLSLGVYYFALVLLGWPYYAASALSVVSGVIVGFKAHGALVFKGSGSFIQYVGVWSALYLANIASIWLIRDYTGDYWAPIILLPITVLTSYFLLKKLIYKTK